MKTGKMDNSCYLRIDRGEEIVSSIKEFCAKNGIVAGLISGLGSVSKAELGLFDVEDKQYLKTEISGIHEIASLTGNISTMDGETYLHIHAVLSDRQCRAFGGHFAMGIVGATCEIVIVPSKGNAGRIKDEEIGLNLLDFSD